MDAYVLIFHHDPAGLRERFRHIHRLGQVESRRREPLAQLRFVAVSRDRQALDRTNVNTRIALDAALGG